MNYSLIFLGRLIENHLYVKIILWVGIVVLGVYIFIMEGRRYLTGINTKKFFRKLFRKKHIDDYPEVRFNISYTDKRIKLLKILWYCITIISIILTITY
ncbi:hypothetical protein ACAG96_08365 [Candidatus Izemoplasma sp. B36]|uniref:hypothetical protein n=1 Tax=Candidatus Izemoplasma sp. B36 TaxID=3242468 RepID=UPI003557F485